MNKVVSLITAFHNIGTIIVFNALPRYPFRDLLLVGRSNMIWQLLRGEFAENLNYLKNKDIKQIQKNLSLLQEIF